MRKNLRREFKVLGFWLAAIGLLWLNGCSSGAANVVSVALSQTAATVIVSQSLTLTATVSGATNLNVTWTCTYTTTPTAVNSKPSNPATCTSDTGNIPANSTAVSVTFTAPNKVPDPTTFPNLVVTITATSVQDKSKTATATINLDSGIAVGLAPVTATVPVKEQQQFAVQLTNDLLSKGVTWLVTQSVPTTTGTTTTTYPQLPSCSVSGNATGCGSIDANGLYTAPAVVPTSTKVTTTPANVTVVVTSVADPTRFALGTITIITGGPITFNGISPTIAPQGAAFWDIFLNAPNISSASTITLTGTKGGPPITLTSITGQVKVLFPIPNTTVTNPASTGARVRLIAANLAATDTYTVSVTDPAETVTTSPTGSYSFTVLPVRPTSIASIPDDIPQGTLNNEIKLSVDGGYFGPNGQLANLLFGGNSIPADSTAISGPRQFNAAFPSAGINSGSPGLYQLSLSRTTPPLPVPDNPAVTNLAVFPDYSQNPPVVVSSVAAGTNPSAIDIDPILGVVAVAETGSNAIQFYTIGKGTLTPLGSPITSATTAGVTINAPTGVSVNRANHTVAVVNYGDQSVSVLPIPGAPQQAAGTPFNVSLANAISALNTTTTAYAIGVDPDTNLAVVAYSNPSTTNLANIGLIVNLNPNTGSNPYGCALDHTVNSGSTKVGQCLYAQVSLNTGSYPQIAMAPHGHLAFVTPGGSGAVLGIDVTKPSASVGVTTVSLASSIVTVTTSSAHNLNPGNPGTVLISGVTSAATKSVVNEFNGAFPVSAVLSSTQFTYAVTSTINDTGMGGTVYFSSPNLTFGISQTSQGIAINPITRTAAIADANATGSNGPQINLLNSLDQSVTSIFFNAQCTFYVTAPTPCLSSPELLGTTDVAWQPYSNALVSYNPQQNQVSVSNPVSLRRFAFACQSAAACQVNPIIPSQVTLTGSGAATITVQFSGGGSGSLNLFGGLTVDPATNQAFVVMSGSGTIDVINLGPSTTNTLKTAQITELVVPSKSPGPGIIGGIPNAIVPQGALTCIPTPPAPTSSCDLAGVQIYGSGFAAGAQVRLDGASIPPANVQVVNSRQLTVTIPASFLSFPHRYAVDVMSGGVQSNATDLFVIQAVDVSQVCAGVTNPQPSSVAIADQLANGPFSPIAVVSMSGCNSITVIDINPGSATFGKVKNTIAVGTTPMGVAISQHLGMAVVANNGGNTVSVVNLLTGAEAVPDITSSEGIGTNPTGVAINEGTGAAIVTNTASSTVTEIDLSPLFGTTPPTSLKGISIAVDQEPIAVAIDPDRGTNNMGLAVVTALQLLSGSEPQGALDSVDIGAATPVKSITGTPGSITAAPTDVVFDPSVFPALFYANSSGGNVIASFNPDTGSATVTSVGINPTSLALNPQTGAILTSNSASNTISIVDTVSNPFRTRQTLGLPGSPQFGVAIDQFTNLAVIVDQAHNRVFLFQMPN